jgi:hypothetical protein
MFMFRPLEQLEERRMMAGDFEPILLEPIYTFPLPTPLVVEGTSGNDSIYVSRDADGNVVVNNNGAVSTHTGWLVSKVVVNGHNGNDFIYGYSNLTHRMEVNGGYGNDSIYGGAAADQLWGAGGTDYIVGNDGNDSLDGGVGGLAYYSENDGNDSVFGGYGDDTMYASDLGNCYLSGSYGNDNLYGYSGADTFYGSLGNDYISSGAGADLIYAGSDNDTVYAGSGDDAVHGESGDDWLYGQDGNDKLYGGAGCDVLVGGNGNDTLVSIGGGQNDCLYGESGYDSFWADSEGTENIWDADYAETVNGHVHRVGSFMNYTYKNGSPWPWDWTNIGVSRELNGQNLAEPINGGAYSANFSNRPIFASGGPSRDDIDQNGLPDCYFLATLGAVAKANPDRIRQRVTELGDGTYGVQFGNTFIRVDGDLPTNSGGSLINAGLGTGNSLWVAIMEKAWAFYRKGDSDWNSTGWGWMDEAFSAMGVGTNTLNVDGWYKFWNNANNLWDYVCGELAAGKATTIGTNGDATALVGSHAYMVESVYIDGYGVRRVVLRNPWGSAGAPGAYVTISAQQLFDSIGRVQSAYV